MKQGILIALVFFIALPKASFTQVGESPRSVPKELWKGIYFGGSKIGYSHALVTRDGGLTRITEETQFNVNTMGVSQNVKAKVDYTLRGENLKSFSFKMKSGETEFLGRGESEEDEMRVTVDSPSGSSSFAYPLSGKPVIFPILYRMLAERNPHQGEELSFRVFDPFSAVTGAPPESMVAKVKVLGRESVTIGETAYNALKAEVHFQGNKSTVWIMQSGDVVKEVADPGFLTLVEPGDKASHGIDGDFDIAKSTAISSNLPLDHARKLVYLKARIYGIREDSKLDMDDGTRQRFREGVLEVLSPDLGKVSSYKIPFAGRGMGEFLEPSPLIQSHNPKIVSLASEILSEETDSLAAARKIAIWVYKTLRKEPTVSVPSALDVLATKRGDCNEHSVLYAALARAAGIPTKIALGVVYLDGKFYYHAWNEIYSGEWIPVDATFGQMPADASHIKLIEGDIARGSEIMGLVGKIKIEIEEASADGRQ
jgi:transglutaminase-like putative cysteine protease